MAAKAEDQEEVDNIDFANYKGIYAEEESDQKYTCPVTGAHFEFKDVCRRLGKVLAGRKRMEEQEALKAQQKQAAKQKADVFSSSTMSVSEEIAARNNFHSNNTHHTQAVYARQQQQIQMQQNQQQNQQQQAWQHQQQQHVMHSSKQQQQQHLASQQQQSSQHQQQHQQHQHHQHHQTQGTSASNASNLKHKKAQSNQIQMQQQTGAGNHMGSSTNNQVSSTASKQKQSSSSQIVHKQGSSSNDGGGVSAGHKFHLDTFVGSEGPVKYTNKTGQSATRAQQQQQQQQMQLVAQNNMDSLDTDSVQQSTAKQLSRMNQQQISNGGQMQPGGASGGSSQQQKGGGVLKSTYLQRNMTEVNGPNQQPNNNNNVKKNNFFTEPDESMIQQSILLQHNQFYGLQQQDQQQQQQQQLQAAMQHAGQIPQQQQQHQHYAGLSIDQQRQAAAASGHQQQMFNLVAGGGEQRGADSQLAQHYSSNPVVNNKATSKDGGKFGHQSSANSGKSSGAIHSAVNHHHQRTQASHFATQDNRHVQQTTSFSSQINQKSTGQLSTGGGMPQPYITSASKTAQGKVRKSTSLKTGGGSGNNHNGSNANASLAMSSHHQDQQMQQEQAIWHQMQQQQIQIGPNGQPLVPGHPGMQNQYQNAEQYNQLMAQLLKQQQQQQQQKSQSVATQGAIGTNSSNMEKSNRTRTKSNATTSSMHGLGGGTKEQKLVSGKQSLQKTSGGSQFIGNVQPQVMGGNQLQSQTFAVTDSSQYYSNGLQGPHTKTQQPTHKPAPSGSRNRDGSSVSIGNRKNSSSQQKASLSNYIRQSQGGKQLKSSIASRNTQGIGGHLNSQVSKHGHRSVASSGQQFSTMGNYHSNKQQHTGHKSSNLIQPGGTGQAANPTHKIIDEVVLRLSQQQNQTNNLAMQPQISGSRNQKNLMVSHTTGGPQSINKSSNKHKSSGYFDQQAFQDIMQKYQRSNRQGGGSSSGVHQTNKYVQGSATATAMHSGKQYNSQGGVQNIVSSASQMNAKQLSAKKQARLSQYVHKEQKSRNANGHGVGTSKTINDTLHQQSIISQQPLSSEPTQKEARSLKQGGKAVSNQSRPMTSSNYQSHSGMPQKSMSKQVAGQNSNTFSSATIHQQQIGDMYHLNSHHAVHQQQHHGQGLSVTGASKSKLAGPSAKPTIAINGTTKRKTTSQSNLTADQQAKQTKTSASRTHQNQKVHLQQAQHPPQQPMYQQEIHSTQNSEQMIMNYVNRMQQQQQQQQQQMSMEMQQHHHHEAQLISQSQQQQQTQKSKASKKL